MDPKVLWDLVKVFLPLSFLAVGGGQSITADVHRQSVDVYAWVSNSQFMDLFALSRLTPGPGALLVPLVGLQAAGVLGAVVAAFAIFLPSSLLVFGLAHVWSRFKGTPVIRAIEAGLVPVAAGMVLSASLTVLRAAEGGGWAWAVAGMSTLALIYTRVSPFVMLGGGALVFLAVFH